MPHLRDRVIYSSVLAALKWSPAVGIVGLRQVGKTTLVTQATQELKGDFARIRQDVTGRHRAFDKLIKESRLTDPMSLARHAHIGGLPIPCFTRDAAQRTAWYNQYFETLLTRDLSLYDERLYRVGFRQGMSLLTELARLQQEELNVSRLMNVSGLSRPLLQLFLKALEALCILDFIPAWRHRRKAVKKMQIQWKDTGLWSAVTHTIPEDVMNSLRAVNLLLSTEWRAQLQFLSGPVLWHSYRHRDGSYLPWIFRQGETVLAITYLPVENPGLNELRLMTRFLADQRHSLAVVLASPKSTPLLVNPRLMMLPMNTVF